MHELTIHETENVSGGFHWLANLFGTRTTLLPMLPTIEVEMV